MKEKRTARRFKANLRTRWEGDRGFHDGTIRDISTGGCFVFTPVPVNDRDFVRTTVQLPGEGEVYLWGEVVTLIEGVGFGLRFTGATGGRDSAIKLIVEACERTIENSGRIKTIERIERF
jgi:hypothetical protein